MTEVTAKPCPGRLAGRGTALLWAFVIFSAMGLLGLALALLDRWDPPTPRSVSFHGASGGQATILWHPLEDHVDPQLRVVLSRGGFEIDRTGCLIDLEEGADRVIPPGAPLVLLGEEGGVAALEPGLPLAVIVELRSRPPGPQESFSEWFRRPEIRELLADLGPRLDRFWAAPVAPPAGPGKQQANS